MLQSRHGSRVGCIAQDACRCHTSLGRQGRPASVLLVGRLIHSWFAKHPGIADELRLVLHIAQHHEVGIRAVKDPDSIAVVLWRDLERIYDVNHRIASVYASVQRIEEMFVSIDQPVGSPMQVRSR